MDGHLKHIIFRWGVLTGLIMFLAACSRFELPTPVPTLDLPTSLPVTGEAGLENAPTATAPPPHTDQPTSTAQAEPSAAPTAIPATNTPGPTASPTLSPTGSDNYAVAFVAENDTLNVRSGPGVSFAIVGTLPPDANDVKIIGAGQLVSGSTWVPVQRGGVAGWVNSRFLTTFISEDSFCNNAEVIDLLNQFKTAVANQDNVLLAELIHPERGLRVSLLWYEKETRLDNLNLLNDPTSYNWGDAAGSGEPIIGTPAQILLPRLEADLLGATEMACNEILHGGTPGFVILPDGYSPLNFYSFYRPGTDEFAGLNWGSWAVGLDQWQDRYYIATLVHYQWEP